MHPVEVLGNRLGLVALQWADEMPLQVTPRNGRNLVDAFLHVVLTESTLAGIPVLGLRSTHLSFAQAGDEWLYVLRPPHYRVVTVAGRTLTSEIVEVPL